MIKTKLFINIFILLVRMNVSKLCEVYEAYEQQQKIKLIMKAVNFPWADFDFE